jgi:glutathione S-transferase
MTSEMILYDYELSADCYQARLMLALLGLEYRRVDVEFHPGREHESEWFTQLSPLNRLPVLREGDLTVNDVHAVLLYLVTRHDGSGRWYPRDDPALLAAVTQWLGFARAVSASAGAARLHDSFGEPADVTVDRRTAHRLLRVLDDHLWFGEQEGRSWLCLGDAPTVADVALFPEVALSEEGGVSRADYPAVRRWTDRVKRLDRFVAMSGVFPAGSGLPDPDRCPLQAAGAGGAAARTERRR